MEQRIKYSRECVRVWPGVFMLQEARSQQGARQGGAHSQGSGSQKEEEICLCQDVWGCGYQAGREMLDVALEEAGTEGRGLEPKDLPPHPERCWVLPAF